MISAARLEPLNLQNPKACRKSAEDQWSVSMICQSL